MLLHFFCFCPYLYVVFFAAPIVFRFMGPSSILCFGYSCLSVLDFFPCILLQHFFLLLLQSSAIICSFYFSGCCHLLYCVSFAFTSFLQFYCAFAPFGCFHHLLTSRKCDAFLLAYINASNCVFVLFVLFKLHAFPCHLPLP